MAPSGVAGGLTQSSASSGIFFQGDAHPQQNLMHSNHFSSSFANSVNSIHGTGRSGLGPVSGDINQTVLHSVANSCPSVGASSFVTDANSAFPGGPQLQRSASINNESYMRLPASPMSFSSNNISVSNSSIIDGPSAVHHSTHSHPDPNSQQHSNHLQHHHLHSGVSGSTSMPTSQMGQVPMPMGSRIQSSYMQDPASLSQVQKKPRLDIKQEDIVQQQVLQQLLQRQQDPTMQLQSHNPQLQAFIQQQQRFRQQQQQQLLQSMPQMQRAQLQQQPQQQQHQQQLRNQLQPQNMQQMALMKNPYDTGGICARRLMQYLFHQRRPADNNIAYWRKFVSEYYAPRAKKRWCLSLYDNVVHHTFGVFPQAAMDAWHCEICGTKSGRGFEATYEVLPRLNEIKFSSGVIDELLFLDLPRERRFASGIMMLEYKKAVQESIYEQARVVREGQLRIIFAQDLKILSWEFCAQRHEELLPRRLVTSQVNQLLQVAQKCQSTVSESGSENGPSSQDLQSSSNMMVTAGRQLAKSLELQSLNDLGFSKRYVRCLQIAEVVNSMKDLIDFCRDNKAGPIDGLKNYPRHSSAKLMMQKMQEMEQLATMQGLPTDRATLNKLMVMHSGMNNSQADPNPNLTSSRGALSGPAAAALALSAHQGMLLRNNSMTSSHNSLQQEPSSSFNNANPSPSSPSIQGPSNSAMLSGPIPNIPVSGGFSSPQHSGGAQLLSARGPNAGGQLHPSQLGHPQPPKQPSPALQQQMIQQLLQQMNNNGSSAGQSKPLVGMNKNAGGVVNGVGYGINTNGGGNRGAVLTPVAAASSNMGGGNAGSSGPVLNKSNSFKSDSSAAGGGGGTNSAFNGKGGAASGGGDLSSQNMHLADEMVQEMTNGFTDSGFFGSELDDNIGGYGWKA